MRLGQYPRVASSPYLPWGGPPLLLEVGVVAKHRGDVWFHVQSPRAGVVELADTAPCQGAERKLVRVQIPSPAHHPSPAWCSIPDS